MLKRFRKSLEPAIIGDTSSSDEDGLNVSFVQKKYARARRTETNNVELNISDTSSDELNDQERFEEQENKKWLQNLKRYSSSQKPLQLTPQNKFQPLSLSVNPKTKSPPPNLFSCTSNAVDCAESTPAASWHNVKKTFAIFKNESRGVLRASSSNSSNQSFTEDTFLNCSIEANLETMVDSQQIPKSNKKISLSHKKKRCVKGGYVHEYKQLMLKERMDRRSLAHNQRLGITSGQHVHVLSMCESFGTHMARVQTKNEPIAIFNIIVAPSMASNIREGSTLELYFDPKVETKLHLPNKEAVYLQPNKIVLL